MTPDRDVNSSAAEPSDAEAPADQHDGSANGGGGGESGGRTSHPADQTASDSSSVVDDPLGFGGHRMGDGPVEGEVFDMDGGLGAGLAGAAAAARGGAGDGASVDADVPTLQAALEQAELKAAEHWDRLLRLQADMENQRKRAQKDVSNARKFALEAIVDDLLPVKDSLELGLVAAEAEDANLTSIREGAELTLKMLGGVFDKNNIVEINPLDEKFDPAFHQAMSMQAVEGKAANTVTSVMQKGYTLNDRLVRPALVMVAK